MAMAFLLVGGHGGHRIRRRVVVGARDLRVTTVLGSFFQNLLFSDLNPFLSPECNSSSIS